MLYLCSKKKLKGPLPGLNYLQLASRPFRNFRKKNRSFSIMFLFITNWATYSQGGESHPKPSLESSLRDRYAC